MSDLPPGVVARGSIVGNSAAPLSEEARTAAKAAAAIMGMNNIYYRSLHLMNNQEYTTLPARLRMNVIANPGVDKLDTFAGDGDRLDELIWLDFLL